MKKTSFVLSSVALVLSLFSLYMACINPEKDSSPNLIATLGIICTVLIGWQIFALIDLRSYEKKLSNLESRLIKNERDQSALEKRLNDNSKSLKSSNEYKDRRDSILYDWLAKTFSYLAIVAPDYASDFLYEEINLHLQAQSLLLRNGTPFDLKIELSLIEECATREVSLSMNQKNSLEKTAIDLLDKLNLEYTSGSSYSMDAYAEKKEIVESTILIIRHLPVKPWKVS